MKEEAAVPGRAERDSRYRDFIYEERGNVLELFDLIVWREAGWASSLAGTKQRL